MRNKERSTKVWAVFVVVALTLYVKTVAPMLLEILANAGYPLELVFVLPILLGIGAPRLWHWLAYQPVLEQGAPSASGQFRV